MHAAPTVRSNTGFVVLCLGLVVAGLMSVLMLNLARAESSYILSDLRQEATALHDERVTLEAELSAKQAPEALALEAQRLGMVPSPSTAVLRLSDATVLGVAAGVDPDARLSVVMNSAAPLAEQHLRRARTVLTDALTEG